MSESLESVKEHRLAAPLKETGVFGLGDCGTDAAMSGSARHCRTDGGSGWWRETARC
jgi:hypothetical protein